MDETPVLTPWIDGASLPLDNRVIDPIRHPYSGTAAARAARGTEADLELAIGAAQAGFSRMRALARHERRDILARIADALLRERASLGEELARSAGKPIGQALGEVDRAILTFSFAADEARRFGGETVPLDVDPRTIGYAGLTSRFAVGPISAISPFNFPLNLLAHKVAPAIAVGSSLVVKPPPQCPQLAFRLARLMAECGLPKGACNVLHLPVPVAERLATDPRFAMLSFTGSPGVGWHLKQVAGRKKVVLELGGNAAAVIHEDAENLDWVAQRLAVGAFSYAGQVCIKVQRLLVHRPIYDRFVQKFVDASAALVTGDPLEPRTVVGPMIDAAAADRVERWIGEAVAAGARALLPARRDGNVLSPTILANAPRDAKVTCQEIFGPVATVAPYEDWAEALRTVNDSEYGLQAGVFTRDVKRIFTAFNTLEVGGVVVNDFPTLRVDNFPYGGVKASGFGREGIRYAMEEMTEPRMLVLNLTR
ncbi:MAG TPA: aldehyde dehydrogenase family protein [Gemmatimonadales bacterium]|nr:aldehyde dehydrogenase family protein [Gemmatimonadales bacterium]